MQRLPTLRKFFRSFPAVGRVKLQTVPFVPNTSLADTLHFPATSQAAAGDDDGATFFNNDDPVALVHLCNPERRNALTCAMMHDLDEIVSTLEHDFRGSCVILTGDGDKAFCAGADLRAVKDGLSSSEAGGMMNEYMQLILQRWRRLPQISIAAINGFAVGGGAELITACDHRIAAPDATIQVGGWLPVQTRLPCSSAGVCIKWRSHQHCVCWLCIYLVPVCIDLQCKTAVCSRQNGDLARLGRRHPFDSPGGAISSPSTARGRAAA